MSYILDALTKAAQQRDRQIPVVQRLLSPAPRVRSPWSHASGRVLAALALNAVLLGAVLFWWLRPVPTPAPPPESAGLRLEALIYADAPAERMVFINGRRYREGDSIDGRLRIEEIKEEGVELSDQGRRFILRVSR